MKNYFCLLILTAVCCNTADNSREVIPPPEPSQHEWVTYEGRVPLDGERFLYMEVSLRTSNEGEGEFRLEESLEVDGASERISSLEGGYTTLQTQEERIIQFHDTELEDGVSRTYLVPGPGGNTAKARPKIRQEGFRKSNLTVRMTDPDRLVVLDDHMQVISEDREHNLVRRLTKPFTVEGYFRHNGFSADFAEINTGERWVVTKYGAYEKAIRLYYELTEKKFDITYLKGIGYPVRVVDEKGRQVEGLVIKKVLQMTAAPREITH